jgi:6-phosphofructokinase 1
MEIMGRNAGWLTAATALARQERIDAPHLVYVPERPVSMEQIMEDVNRIHEELGFCVVAMSEGTMDLEGNPIGNPPVEVDAFGHQRKGGVTPHLANVINDELGLKTRLDNPYYLQRSFVEIASPVDQEEAYRVGRQAVRAALAGYKGQMVTLVRDPGPDYHCSTGLIDVEKVADKERVMDKDMMNEDGNFPSEKFMDYASPLIGGPLSEQARLEMVPVEETA